MIFFQSLSLLAVAGTPGVRGPRLTKFIAVRVIDAPKKGPFCTIRCHRVYVKSPSSLDVSRIPPNLRGSPAATFTTAPKTLPQSSHPLFFCCRLLPLVYSLVEPSALATAEPDRAGEFLLMVG